MEWGCHLMNHVFSVPVDEAGYRLDQFLVKSLPQYSRTFFQQLIDNGLVAINGTTQTKAGYKVSAGQQITIAMPPPHPIRELAQAEIDALGIEIVAEHPDFLIIYKPAGVLVHVPHPSSPTVTLVDWIEYYHKDIARVGMLDRPGIVHRLDKDTSGLLIIARTNYAHQQFTRLFKERAIHKTYYALVAGHPPREGSITFAIDRHPVHRHKMTHVSAYGRPAHTDYRVVEYFKDATYLQVHPITGRTHQIRVHCAAIGHPIIGDPLYGKQSSLIKRQALHAYQVAFEYDGTSYTFTKEIPADFAHALTQLRCE